MKVVEIIGGGLSGLSLGIFLRKLGVPVKVVEAGSYPRHKVCGEFVCGVADEVLQQMGIEGAFRGALRHERMAWWLGDDRVLEDRLPQQALGLSRFFLDAELSGMFVAAGGELLTHQRAGKEDAHGRVWAAGKAKGANARGKRRGKSRAEWIGLKLHARNLEIDGLEMHVGKRGYLGLCGIENSRVNCCGLFRLDKKVRAVHKKDIMASYMEANGMHQLLDRFRSWDIDEDSLSATAGFSLGAQGRAGNFCIGDAALLIAPFTGNGMSMAIESAWLAGPWLQKFSCGELEWPEACAAYVAARENHFKKRM